MVVQDYNHMLLPFPCCLPIEIKFWKYFVLEFVVSSWVRTKEEEGSLRFSKHSLNRRINLLFFSYSHVSTWHLTVCFNLFEIPHMQSLLCASSHGPWTCHLMARIHLILRGNRNCMMWIRWLQHFLSLSFCSFSLFSFFFWISVGSCFWAYHFTQIPLLLSGLHPL